MGNKKKSKLSFLTPLLVAGALLSTKLKSVLLLGSKWLSFAKLGWLVTKSWTLWLSLTLYAATFGWSLAWMLVLVLFLHEGGHWIWMRAYGLNPGLPTFIPFLGAFVAMKKLPKDEASHAWVAFAGPLIGGVTSALLYWIGVIINNTWLMTTGHLGSILNLLQLIPAKPLDGGFVISAVSTRLLIPGVIFLVIFSIYRQSIFLFVIAIFSIFTLLESFTGKAQLELQANASSASTVGALVSEIEKISATEIMRSATTTQRWIIGIAYLVLAASLGQLYAISSDQLPSLLGH